MEPPLAAYSGGRLLWSTMLLVPHVPSPAYHAAHDMHDASVGAHLKSCPDRVLQHLCHHLTC